MDFHGEIDPLFTRSPDGGDNFLNHLKERLESLIQFSSLPRQAESSPDTCWPVWPIILRFSLRRTMG